MKVTTVGRDLDNRIFQVHAGDTSGAVVYSSGDARDCRYAVVGACMAT